MNFKTGTKQYERYPTAEQNFSQFTYETTSDRKCRNMYFDHLPVWMNGNVYFNGAEPCEEEENCRILLESVSIKLQSDANGILLETNLFELLPDAELLMIDTKLLGEALEPEENFDNQYGTPICFNRDFFGRVRDLAIVAGPFANVKDARKVLFNT